MQMDVMEAGLILLLHMVSLMESSQKPISLTKEFTNIKLYAIRILDINRITNFL